MYFTAQDVVENKVQAHVVNAVVAALAVSATSPEAFSARSNDSSDAMRSYGSLCNYTLSQSLARRMDSYDVTPQTTRAVEWLRTNTNGQTLTLEQAEAGIAALKDGITFVDGYTFSKWHRPWESYRSAEELPNRLKLGRDKVWVGVEIEIGASSAANMHSIRQYLLNNFEFVTADREGGQFPIEATFPPCEMGKLLAKDSYISRYYADVLTTDQVVAHASNALVGTHFNISTPYTRRVNAGNLADNSNTLITMLIAESNAATPSGNARHNAAGTLVHKLFGRYPYGVAYSHGKFAEYKLFNSTRNPEHFAWYARVMKALIKGADERRFTSADIASRMVALRRLAAKSPL